jgi:hypothetical protein
MAQARDPCTSRDVYAYAPQAPDGALGRTTVPCLRSGAALQSPEAPGSRIRDGVDVVRRERVEEALGRAREAREGMRPFVRGRTLERFDGVVESRRNGPGTKRDAIAGR